MSENPIIWQPGKDRVRASAMYRFMQNQGFDNYADLYQWSITDLTGFWSAVCQFCELQFSRPAEQLLTRPDDIMHAGWFAGSQLNFAAHLLRHQGSQAAIVFCGEDGARRELSRDQLRSAVAACAAGLRRAGVTRGDRVAAYLPNCPEAIIAMLAATSIGAVWSSCSPDFGVNGIVDRFGQIEPKVFIATNGYIYNSKRIDCLNSVQEVVARIGSIKATVIVEFRHDLGLPAKSDLVRWHDFLAPGEELTFAAVDFDHPLYIMFSSGTTGVPKCIVHGHGGTLLKHACELLLHTDIHADDRVFYFTTCGWMMWNWLVSGLLGGATLMLFDGAPFVGDGRELWSMVEREKISIFGTSAKYLSALEKTGLRPRDDFDLASVRTILSTGSPLAPESFDYVYAAIKSDVLLGSIAGGTDLLGCFAAANPLLPVRRGELQCRGLGMAVEIFDENGNPVIEQKGELVCTRPFPSAPVCFWNDPHGARYRAAYFERFPGVWAHGDFAELKNTGGMVIHGRSDAVLNPGGVRIGTAEIYRQVEKLDEIMESIAIGQQWKGDVRVVLFVVLRSGVELDGELRGRIRKVIRAGATPRHVPAKIIAVQDIPRTKSGKLVELAVRSVVHGESIRNTEALANPAALAHFRNIAELGED
ncbi:MAG: acetoacetate--CoA ligase [Gammaproteobacteria bacterium]|nr:acetoacetate--CoA ligase [Gammaproteobacteria bacterium]MDH5302517.1 acetoacetate--CoA ligase [Gammaproteobacteria bacterium]MDH5322301.1 acetoacetate--CoA ligase [Gammaproteobacteria bacterium]